MAKFYYYKYFEKDALADAATYEDTWTADEDLIIHRIYLMDKAGSAFTKSTFYLKVGPDVFTRTVVPAKILGATIFDSPVLDVELKNGVQLAFTFKNLEGAAKSIMICIEVHK